MEQIADNRSRPGWRYLLATLAVAVLALVGLGLMAQPANAQPAYGSKGPQVPLDTSTPTSTSSPTASPTCSTTSNYFFVPTSGATVEPGIYDIGNHCDDCVTAITLPFPVRFYDQFFTSANISSNGNLQFLSSNAAGGNHCLPESTFNYAIVPLWDNLDTSGAGRGVFTSVTGIAPDRIFNIEWRAFSGSGHGDVNPEIRLYESGTTLEIVYGIFATPNNSSTVGVQKDTGSQYVVYACNGGTGQLASGLRLTIQWVCGTPTTTSTSTRTATITPTQPTSTFTATSTRTSTASNTATSTRTPTNTPTDTATNTPSNTPTSTFTHTPTSTFTNTPTDTSTPTSTPTSTSTNTPTDTYTSTPTNTPTST
ncbi:MAG: hypothetical protein ACJ78Q_04245, partial [Chloroflexia bacterium]